MTNRTGNGIIYTMIIVTFIVIFGSMPFAIQFAKEKYHKFEIACKNLNGDVLKGEERFICIKTGSIITLPDE
jgi:hypothetical protein